MKTTKVLREELATMVKNMLDQLIHFDTVNPNVKEYMRLKSRLGEYLTELKSDVTFYVVATEDFTKYTY